MTDDTDTDKELKLTPGEVVVVDIVEPFFSAHPVVPPSKSPLKIKFGVTSKLLVSTLITLAPAAFCTWKEFGVLVRFLNTELPSTISVPLSAILTEPRLLEPVTTKALELFKNTLKLVEPLLEETMSTIPSLFRSAMATP